MGKEKIQTKRRSKLRLKSWMTMNKALSVTPTMKMRKVIFKSPMVSNFY